MPFEDKRVLISVLSLGMVQKLPVKVYKLTHPLFLPRNALVPGAYMRLRVKDRCQLYAGFRNTSFTILLELNVSPFYCNECKSDLDSGPLRAY